MPASGNPAVIPAVPAPPEFVDRAKVVADAVRAAGIPKPPEGIFLRGTRSPGLAFDTTEQKLAWSAGNVVIAPGVRIPPGGGSRVDFADGSSVPTTVLDARPALAGEIGSQASNCRSIPAALCKLTITAVTLGTAKIDTTRGPATGPAWSFTVKGLSIKIVVLAVPQDVLKSPALPVPPTSLPTPSRNLLSPDALRRADGNILTFTLNHGACDPNLASHVVEYDDLVVIGGTHTAFSGGCIAVLRSTPTTITLTQPLGDRAVITADTGIRLFVDPPR
ncbi:hypothetical protein AB0L70_08795 [Kribbella sp. NPDC051952]|uniref:hypothetical protein n=1 Tax=Kribbella sp. NPDC051952 TaxID=3154851 RepID=UPI0034253C5C